MTLTEKIDLLGGTGFGTRAIPRLGVPALQMTDGPVGVRNFGPAIAYPAPVCLAACFDPELARQYGVAIGKDCRSNGAHVWLGPGVNLSRVPQNGRNFEYFGEDPFLASRTAVNVVEGVQSQGVAATVKHFAANDEEADRTENSSNVDERTLRELYLKPFDAAIQEGGAWAVMAAYNKLNGAWCAENPWLLTTVLKEDWGFHGVAMSDWGATRSLVPSLNAGLDLDMGSGGFFNNVLVPPVVSSGQVSVAVVDDKVRRILRLIYSNDFDKRPQLDSSISHDDPANEAVALQIAREGTVLLKNRGGLLPLDPGRKRMILVVGPNAEKAVTGGGGSSYIDPIRKISLLEAIQAQAGPHDTVLYEPLTDGKIPAAEVRSADVIIAVVGFNKEIEGEGRDRSFGLPLAQESMLEQIVALNPRVVVVNNSGAGVDMSAWVDKAGAIIQGWYPGGTGNQAIAEILFGKVNPSGKLPVSFPRTLKSTYYETAYPPVNGQVDYKEGLFMGYRWFDQNKVDPLFPFGFGLSYTTFRMDRFRFDPAGKDSATLTVHIRNTGRREGTETIQVYVHPKASQVVRPVKELKAFQRVSLKAGEDANVAIPLKLADVAYFDVKAHKWVLEPGRYDLLVGTSSRNLPLKGYLQIGP